MQLIGWLWPIVGVLGIIDAFRHPASAWAGADRNRPFWTIWMLFFGPIVVPIYLVSIRPRLTQGRAFSDEFRR